jgi:hypothetical protein
MRDESERLLADIPQWAVTTYKPVVRALIGGIIGEAKTLPGGRGD